MKHLRKIAFPAVLAFGAAVTATTAVAQDEFYAVDDAWTYEFSLYLWGSEVGGVANGADFEIGFDDLVDNLDFALVGALKAFNGPWMTYGELNYANISSGGSASYRLSPTELDIGLDVDAVASADIKTVFVNLGVGYQLVETDSYNLYGTLGARYFKMDADLTLDLDSAIGGRSFNVDESSDFWDAVVGIAGRAAFNENWFMSYVLDVGAGQSDLTWQAMAGIGYDFGRQDVVLGYRHLEWDLPEDQVLTEYYMSGPVLLWNIRF